MKKRGLTLLIALLVSVSLLSGCKQESKTLNIFTWENYVPKEVIDEFAKQTGITVNYSTFSTNEEMLSILQAQKGQHDIVVCSDYIIDIMQKEGGLIQELDKSKLPNFKNIDPNFQGKYFDPENKFTIPHASGCAIMVYDSAKVKEKITSYDDLWRPEFKDKVVLVDGDRDIIGLTLQTLGYSVNEKDQAKLNQAKEKLLKLKPNVISFDANTPYEAIIRGDAVIGYMFGSQATAAKQAVPTVEFVYPKEGMTLFIDNYVLADGAPNKANAHKFLDYILQPEVSAKISTTINYLNTNTAARPFLTKEFIENKSVNIPSEALKNAQSYQDLGETTQAYSDIWTEFKSK